MKQCLKIVFELHDADNILQNHIQKHARRLHIEGTADMIEPSIVRVLACGVKDAMEEFIDLIYKGTTKVRPESIEVEPFIKDRDFRGVFRIIE